MATTIHASEWLTLAEAARLLRISPQTVRRLIQRDELPAYRVGSVELRINRDELDDYLRSRRVTAPANVRDGRRRGGRPGRRAAGRGDTGNGPHGIAGT